MPENITSHFILNTLLKQQQLEVMANIYQYRADTKKLSLNLLAKHNFLV